MLRGICEFWIDMVVLINRLPTPNTAKTTSLAHLTHDWIRNVPGKPMLISLRHRLMLAGIDFCWKHKPPQLTSATEARTACIEAGSLAGCHCKPASCRGRGDTLRAG